MQLRLFWTKLIEDVKQWVKGCYHCVSYKVWRNKKQELYFYLSFTIPFYIINLGIWSPGTAIYKNQEGCHLLNAICDLTHFIILSITTDTKSKSLAKLFMEEFMSSLGMV